MATAAAAIQHLNSLLRGELAAVDAYRRAFDKVKHFPEKHELVECERSHNERATLLRTRILQLGGDPVDSSGVWGTFATIVETTAAALADTLAIAVLEEGEDLGLKDYKKELVELDADSRALVESRLLPEQVRTHQMVRSLKSVLRQT